MATLSEKIEHAVDENRILVLGVQVLLGFQLESFFQREYESLPEHSHTLLLAGLFCLIVTLVLLLAPTSYHRLVHSREDTGDLHRFVTLMTGSSLLPFALGLGSAFFVAAEVILGFTGGIATGVVALLVALFFWYGLELFERKKRRKGLTSMNSQQGERKSTPLDKKIDRAFTETRIVLPGTQALIGFQFLIILTQAFAGMPEWLRSLHLASLACAGISVILLMAPAAYHRIVEEGEDSERVLRFTSIMVLSAMIFLAIGISGDTVVIVAKATESVSFAVVCGVVVLALSLLLWFGFTLYRRQRYQSR